MLILTVVSIELVLRKVDSTDKKSLFFVSIKYYCVLKLVLEGFNNTTVTIGVGFNCDNRKFLAYFMKMCALKTSALSVLWRSLTAIYG